MRQRDAANPLKSYPGLAVHTLPKLSMARKTHPSFVVELPLAPTPEDEQRLGKGLFEAAKRLNNALLQSGLALVDAMRASPEWQAAKAMPRKDEDARAARGAAFGLVRKAFKFSDYDFQALAVQHKNAAGFAGRLGANTTQKLGTKVFKALEAYVFGQRGRPRFKGVKRPLHSIEGKNNSADLRWNEDDGCVYLTARWGIRAKLPDLRRDEWLWSALQAPVKYCRIVRRLVAGKNRYSLQLVLQGLAPMKVSLLARLADKSAKAGLDIGPSNIGWCSESDAGFFKFCADVDSPQKLIKRLQRQVDRQSRANNPNNFDEKGRAKRGCTWVKSARQRQTESKLRGAQTHTAEKRVNAHGRDINHLLGKARTFRHDGVSVKSLQKNYGKSVGARAPGLFMSELLRKAARAGGAVKSINVRQLKTSQYDHSSGEFHKKKLSERWHRFGDGRGLCQRDVYSAFLALHVVQTVDADGVIAESHDRELLEKAWVALVPVLQAKGLFMPSESVNQTETKVERDSVAPPHGSGQLTSSESLGLAPVSGAQARGTARVGKFPKTNGLNRNRVRGVGAPLEPRNHRPSGR
jgi:putative transposase